MVNPVTVISPLPGPLTVPLMPPGDEVATYDVIAAPPSCAGAVNVIVACSKPAVAFFKNNLCVKLYLNVVIILCRQTVLID